MLEPAAAHSLPATASQKIGPALLPLRISAERLVIADAGRGLRLLIYRVAEAGRRAEAASGAVDETHTSSSTTGAADGVAVSPGPRGVGARAEIHAAVDAVLRRSGGDSFTVDAVLGELRGRGTRYADSTVRTMITSHLCWNAPDHAAATYDDFERVDRGVYRGHVLVHY